ncbi:hypothetical protein L7F22_058034 [Adiantum nelumboides]|nr:hypothetical protein [Adiantum nelumboides]
MSFSTFNGAAGEDAQEFLDNLEIACLVTGRDDDATRLRVFPLLMKAEAKAWFNTLLPANRGDWAELRVLFLAKFGGGGETSESLWDKVCELRQDSMFEYNVYELQFVELWERWVASLRLGEAARDFLKKDRFVAGLCPPLREKVKGRFSVTWMDARDIARLKERKIRYQLQQRDTDQEEEGMASVPPTNAPAAHRGQGNQDKKELLNRITHQLEDLSVHLVRGGRGPPTNQEQARGPRKQAQEYHCYNCGENGHGMYYCPHPRRIGNFREPRNQVSPPRERQQQQQQQAFPIQQAPPVQILRPPVQPQQQPPSSPPSIAPIPPLPIPENRDVNVISLDAKKNDSWKKELKMAGQAEEIALLKAQVAEMSAVLAKPQVKDFLKTLAKGKEKGQEQRKEHDVNTHAATAEGQPSKKPWEEDIPELSSPSYSPPTSFSYSSDASSFSNPRRQLGWFCALYAQSLDYFVIYYLNSEAAMIDVWIRESITQAQEAGAKVIALGQLNKDRKLDLDEMLLPRKEVSIAVVTGDTLAAAIVAKVVESKHTKDGKEVFITSAQTRVGRAIAIYLCEHGFKVLALLPSKELAENLRNCIFPKFQDNFFYASEYNAGKTCKVWLVGDPLGCEVQNIASQGTHFYQFGVLPIHKSRWDCFYSGVPGLRLPESAQTINACEDVMPRYVVRTSYAAAMVHVLEGLQWHDCDGDISMELMSLYLELALKLGFSIVYGVNSLDHQRPKCTGEEINMIPNVVDNGFSANVADLVLVAIEDGADILVGELGDFVRSLINAKEVAALRFSKHGLSASNAIMPSGMSLLPGIASKAEGAHFAVAAGSTQFRQKSQFRQHAVQVEGAARFVVAAGSSGKNHCRNHCSSDQFRQHAVQAKVAAEIAPEIASQFRCKSLYSIVDFQRCFSYTLAPI